MHSLSFTLPLFLAASVLATVFNPFYTSKVSSLNRRSSGVIAVRSPSELRPRTTFNGTRLHRNHPRWFPASISDSLGPRQLPNSTTKRSPSPADGIDIRPTPEPTGDPSPTRTVHVTDQSNFSLLVPNTPGELISDAESDGVSYCSPGAKSSSETCSNALPAGFITAAAVNHSDDGAYVQVTGCIDPSKFPNIDPKDAGGQFDVRFPNGAQCTFGGYGASFIEQIEPSAKRFCLRCCASANDQVNCNSHKDRQGCPAAIPGVYDFPALGVSCS
ncbi:hypothetical protein Hypma_016177 [Hypsizygus marmoreus]|uniref:Uncharacterized protein n=1 Tax=Hypsizygus marmoreus TaxID=39966 RepID=A0A369J1H9_HYPMA|nr:hypothetical protein Hypma_016177 [Hypsizygus marmoreus]